MVRVCFFFNRWLSIQSSRPTCNGFLRAALSRRIRHFVRRYKSIGGCGGGGGVEGGEEGKAWIQPTDEGEGRARVQRGLRAASERGRAMWQA